MGQQKAQSPVKIGGPGTILPRFVESSLSWSLCISCLSVSGYHWCRTTLVTPAFKYVRQLIRARTRRILDYIGYSSSKEDDGHVENVFEDLGDLPFMKNPFIPLTTSSRNEVSSKSAKERYDQLVWYVSSCVLIDCRKQLKDISDAELVHLFRSNDICRRLASLMMRPYRKTALVSEGDRNKNVLFTTSILEEFPKLEIPKRLAMLWPQLLTLPSYGNYCHALRSQHDDSSNNNNQFPYRISLIIPAFRDSGSELSNKLKKAYENCAHPTSIDLILFDAGGCTNLEQLIIDHDIIVAGKGGPSNLDSRHSPNTPGNWGQAILLPFKQGGGRGPCLNYGASCAHGQFLTFLHSDTKLPFAWDEKVTAALQTIDQYGRRSSSCAFSFGIDTSQEGLADGRYPPGIKAVEATANLRTHLYSLPYGDQCISIPSTVFRFLGGFPDQCLMEDYEIISLLRQRASFLSRYHPCSPDQRKEKVFIIDGAPALCSPRRWQNFGVLYVTYMNSKFINMYAAGLSSDDLFERYYGVSPPQRTFEFSPWEVELEKHLKAS